MVSLAPSSSFVYFLPCTQALPEPLPFSILDPNSNKTVTKDPGPCGSLLPCTRIWVGSGGARQAEGPDRAPLYRCRAWVFFPPFPPQSQRSARGQICFITKNLLRKQNQCCKWDRRDGSPTHPVIGLHPGERISKERPETLYPKQRSLLRLWGPHTSKSLVVTLCSVPSPSGIILGLGRARLAPLLWAGYTVRQGALGRFPHWSHQNVLLVPPQNPVFP